MNKISLLINAKYMYTLQGEGVGFLADHTIAIDNGKILEIAPTADIKEKYEAERVIDAGNKVVMPGFIDAHMHITAGAQRGLAQDIGNWMMDGVGPFMEHRTIETDIAGAKLAVAEAIMNGTTTIGEDGFDPEAILPVIRDFGARVVFAVRVREALNRMYKPGELYEYNAELGEKTLADAIAAVEKWHKKDNNLYSIRFAPQGADFVSKEMFVRIRELAQKYDTKMHLHLSQGDRETRQMMMRYGSRTIPWMIENGFLDENVIGIHLTDAFDEEAAAAAKCGIGMVLCSGSIGIIDGIAPPVKAFQDAGGYAGLGSDQAPGNNCHNIINEMKLTALFNKLKFEDPEVMPAWKVLRMATIEGAKALGIDSYTGSLEAGKCADMILVDFDQLSLAPIYTKPMRNFVPNLVYSARGNEVDTVIINGKVVVENKRPLTFNVKAILEEAQKAADYMAVEAEDTFWEVNGINAKYMKDDKL